MTPDATTGLSRRPPAPEADAAEVLDSILKVGVSLSAVRDHRETLDGILAEVRRLARAEAGSLFVLEGSRLRLAAAHNEHPGAEQVLGRIRGRTVPLSYESLAGFVALTQRTVNLQDAYTLPEGTPFRINRGFDSRSGFRTRSVLALPIRAPAGRCIGVVELLNHRDAAGRHTPFPEADSASIVSLLSMAAVTLHNSLLQQKLREAHLDTIFRLSMAVENRDDDTGQHVRRISLTAAAIARAMSLDAAQIELLFCASPMHDIGKVAVPDSILRKPGPLTPTERDVIMQHPWIGARILGNPPNELIATARDIALCHHERWDGQGYPQRLAGEDIPLCGRIVCAADVFDALVCRRCYKEPYRLETALEILRDERGRMFDPAVADAFFCALEEIIEPYDLTTGEPARAQGA
jgi:HD-GYP domain-containing protein (c-di-GMP phosphodiesterase class II)